MWKFILLLALFASAYCAQNNGKLKSENPKLLSKFAGEIYQVCGSVFILHSLKRLINSFLK